MSQLAAVFAVGLASVAASGAVAATLTGDAAFGDWRSDAPGVVRRITQEDIPPVSRPGVAPAAIVARPAGAQLATLPGFSVAAFVTLEGPRQIRTAPNGDIFVAETDQGRIRVLRTADGADHPVTTETFIDGLDRPFGIAFWPVGANPQWVYIANTNSVVRYPYRSGDLRARGPAQIIVPKLTLTGKGHSTRDVAFSPDSRRMYVSVGSGSNIAEGMGKKTPAEAAAWDGAHAVGAAWGDETGRADVLVMDPLGRGSRVWATGIRNCVSLAIEPRTSDLWCATNERDLLGDDLPPDYATRVRQGAFYGWPWYYIGAHEDPRLKGQRPDLAGKVAVPDVLFQAHSAPLGLTFYIARNGPAAFPAEYRGSAFVGLHGSWNRASRTGYKVVRLILKDGVPTGAYEDFLTGFVVDKNGVWGRPVGVTVAHDGALLVTDDASNIVWRVAYDGRGASAK
ncbi:MAG TPA: PQQ-dependent sugar dehydrogenase [Caulobacteraceae bacterium]